MNILDATEDRNNVPLDVAPLLPPPPLIVSIKFEPRGVPTIMLVQLCDRMRTLRYKHELHLESTGQDGVLSYQRYRRGDRPYKHNVEMALRVNPQTGRIWIDGLLQPELLDPTARTTLSTLQTIAIRGVRKRNEMPCPDIAVEVSERTFHHASQSVSRKLLCAVVNMDLPEKRSCYLRRDMLEKNRIPFFSSREIHKGEPLFDVLRKAHFAHGMSHFINVVPYHGIVFAAGEWSDVTPGDAVDFLVQ